MNVIQQKKIDIIKIVFFQRKREHTKNEDIQTKNFFLYIPQDISDNYLSIYSGVTRVGNKSVFYCLIILLYYFVFLVSNKNSFLRMLFFTLNCRMSYQVIYYLLYFKLFLSISWFYISSTIFMSRVFIIQHVFSFYCLLSAIFIF